MSLQGNKTYAVALLTILVGALAQTDWGKFIEDPKTGIGLLVGGVLMGVMRYVTQITTVKTAELAEPPKAPPAEAP